MFTVPRNTEDDQTVPHIESSETTQNEIKTTRPYEEVIGQYEPFYPTKQFIDFFKELHESIRIFKSHIAEIEIFDNLNSACDDLMDSAYDLHRQFQSSIKEQNMSEQVNHSQNIPDAEANSFVKTLNAVSKQMIFAVSDKDDVNDDLSTLMYRLWGPSQTVAHTIYRRMRGCWQPSTD